MKAIRSFFFWILSTILGKTLYQEDQLLLFNGIQKSVFIQVCSYLLVFFNSILLVRTAAVANYGIYINLFNWLALLAVIAAAGMEDLVLAEIPVLVRSGKKSQVLKLVRLANTAVIIASLLIAAMFAALFFTGAIVIPGLSGRLVFVSLINVYLMAFIVVNQQTLQAFNRFYSSQTADKIIRPALMILVLLSCLFFQLRVDAQLLIIAGTVILLVAAVIVGLLLRKQLLPNSLPADAGGLSGRIAARTAYFVLISVLVLLKSRIGMLIIGISGDTTNVGILNIAYRLSDFVLLPYVLIHAVIPQLFASHINTNPSYKKTLFRKTTFLLSLSSLLIFIVLIIFGKWLLGIYDEQLPQYYYLLLILGASQFLYSFFGPSVSFLMMQNGEKKAAIAMGIDITVNATLFFFLVRKFGLYGAAWAAFAGSLFYNVLVRILVERELKENRI